MSAKLHVPPPVVITIEYYDGQIVRHSLVSALSRIGKRGLSFIKFMDALAALSCEDTNRTMSADEYEAASRDICRDAFGDDHV